MGNRSRILLIAGVAACLPTAAHAGYIVSIVDAETGLAQAGVYPGDSITLDVVLACFADGTGCMHDGADFVVEFSQRGLILERYSWATPPYITGGANDFSTPRNDKLPMSIDSITFSANKVFIDEFPPLFEVRIDLTVPIDWTPIPDLVEVSIADGAAFNDFTNFVFPAVEIASPLSLWIGVPEPATLVLLGIGGIAALRRRRYA